MPETKMESAEWELGRSAWYAWLSHMQSGNFAAAWEISDALLRERSGQVCWHWPRHKQYVWNGEPLVGKRVLVRCYRGLGDTIQFSRFLPKLGAVASEVTVWAQEALLPLLKTLPGEARFVPLHDGTPQADYDVDIEITELAYAFRITLESLPAAVPYLYAVDPHLPSSDELRVGLVWRAGDWALERSVPTALIAQALGCVRGIELHVLQQGAARAEWPREIGVMSGSERVEELAWIMKGLDLVISVDSFPAHLAGALAVPTWTLLNFYSDCRWMAERDDSPWYPTMRLWRQESPGDWQTLLDRISSELGRAHEAFSSLRDGVSAPLLSPKK